MSILTSDHIAGWYLLRKKAANIFDQIPNEHREKMIQIACEIIDETIQDSKMANQVQIYKFMSKIKEYLCNPELSTIGIKPSDNFVKTQLVLAMTHGVTLTLCKDDFICINIGNS